MHFMCTYLHFNKYGYDFSHETLPAAEDMMYIIDNCESPLMARALPPTYLPVSPSCLTEGLREIGDMLEVRSPYILGAERHCATGSRSEPLTIIRIEIQEHPE